MNPLKAKLASGRPVLGIWCIVTSPMLLETVAAAGMDFLILDAEHGGFDFATLETGILACERGGASPLVRSPGPDAVFIQRALDLGADGILVPQIADAATAATAVAQIHFPPRGTRGSHPFTRAGRFGIPGPGKLVPGYPLASVLVENTRSYDELDRILALPDLDMVYLGIYDYSVAIGVPGKVDDPRVDAFVADCTRRARAAGKHVGAIVKDGDGMAKLLALGVDMLVYMCDTWVVQTAIGEAVAVFAAATK